MSSDAERQVRANLKATQNKPILSRQVLGAELNKIIISQPDSKVKSYEWNILMMRIISRFKAMRVEMLLI